MLTVGNLVIPFSEFDLHFARSGGPGGQNVNKVNSKVVLYWTVSTSPSIPDPVRQRFLQKFHHRITAEGVLVLNSDKFRDQKRNIDDCVEKLGEMLKEVLYPPKPRKKTKPGRGAIERRIGDKKAKSQKKQNRRQKLDY